MDGMQFVLFCASCEQCKGQREKKMREKRTDLEQRKSVASLRKKKKTRGRGRRKKKKKILESQE